MSLLARPRMRLERAAMHHREIAEIWEAFLQKDEPYSTVVYVDHDGEGRISVYANDLPDELSLEFGELLYQLRATLDSLVYELAIIDSGQDPPARCGEA